MTDSDFGSLGHYPSSEQFDRVLEALRKADDEDDPDWCGDSLLTLPRLLDAAGVPDRPGMNWLISLIGFLIRCEYVTTTLSDEMLEFEWRDVIEIR